MTIQRGDVFWVDWNPARGSEQAGVRPALVVQNDVGNRASATTIVAAITSRLERVYPFMVRLAADESGLPRDSVVNLSQVVTIAQDRLLPPRGEATLRPLGHVSYPKMTEVDTALRVSLGIG
ncbi:MAG: PemK-like protein [Chloroflexi bacterium]|nr:PemK-like protein [Chloroflexota bacterium]